MKSLLMLVLSTLFTTPLFAASFEEMAGTYQIENCTVIGASTDSQIDYCKYQNLELVAEANQKDIVRFNFTSINPEISPLSFGVNLNLVSTKSVSTYDALSENNSVELVDVSPGQTESTTLLKKLGENKYELQLSTSQTARGAINFNFILQLSKIQSY